METPVRNDDSIIAAPLESDERWRLALRVAASSEFHKSARLRDFLLYICEKALTACPDEIHEQPIGSAVFGRRPDYNPSEDNIVRVEARELRRRLDRFFGAEGRAERFRIRIATPTNGKGSWIRGYGRLLPFCRVGW